MGKGSIVKKLLTSSNEFLLSVSATTRPARAGEVDGVHYHFVSNATFDKMLNENQFLEWAVVHGGHRYGTPISELDRAASAGRQLILEIDVQGAGQVLKHHPDAIDVFVEPPSFGELEARLRGRGTETEEQIRSRLATARTELSQAANFRSRVVNNNLEECAAEVLDLVSARRGKK